MASPPVPPDIQDLRTPVPSVPYIPPPDREFGTIPQPPPPPPYPGYMSPQDLAAFAAKTIADAYAPQLAYLQQQQQRSQQMHAAQQAGLVELYKILSGNMGSLGGDISNIFSSAAQGLDLPSDAVTGDLGVSRDIINSGGLAGPGYGSAYPQLAGQQGQTEFLKAVQEGRAEEQDVGAQIQRLIAEQPAQVQQLLSQLSGQQADYAKAAQPEIRSVGGNLVQIDPTTGRVRVIYQGATGGAGGPPKTFRGPGGSVYGWTQDAKGNWKPQLIAAGSDPAAKPPKTVSGPGGRVDAWVQDKNGNWRLVPVRAGATGTASGGTVQSKTINGRTVVFDPHTGIYYDPATGKPIDPNSLKAGGTSQVVDPITGTPLTKSRIAALEKETIDNIRKAQGSGRRLEEVLAHIPDYVPRAIWVPIVARRYGIPPWVVDGRGLSAKQAGQLRYMGVPRLHNIAVMLGYQPDPRAPLDKRGLVAWITAHAPKGEAAQGAAYNPRRAATQTQPVSYTNWGDIIKSGAVHYGLDPLAVLAVANAEGLGGGVGDNGTSFGPFQLHVGGALPRGKTQAWAESPAGIDYALRQIARVARGLTARQAIEMIVRRFERPADPEGEIARAWTYYQSQFV